MASSPPPRAARGSMSYFFSGLWHFATAMSFAAALGIITHGNLLSWLKHPEFSAALIVSSSALFFVPHEWAKKGLMKFLHYPLPDWDVLLLGPASHRHWLTHSPLFPIVLWLLAEHYPLLLDNSLPYQIIAVGLSIGIGSHLFWDCVGSRSHKIIIVPYWLSLGASASRLYLLTGAAACMLIALRLSL